MNYNPYKKYSMNWWKFWLNLSGDIFDFLERVWDYIPLLWEDRDWDYDYLLKMMRFKIHRMRKNMEQSAIIAHVEDCVVEMATADVLLRNIAEEDPDDEWSRHFDAWHHGVKVGEHCENQKECTRSLKLSSLRDQRNWHNLWKHLEKYLQGWWD